MVKNTVKLTSMIAAIYLFAGYQELSAQTKDSLKEKQIEEVVMVGYGTQKKINVTGSIATLSGKQLENQPNTNPLSSVQGKVAGVQITNSGEPGTSPRVDIRGIGTLNGNTVFIVDGILTDDISFLNPLDIESMSILKDPSSLAIYGSRASKGAVLIKTKSGKGKTIFNFNSYVGFKNVTNVPELVNKNQYVELYNEKLQNEGATSGFINANNYTADTDWFKEIFKSGFINSNDISASGSTEKLNYFVSLNYTTDEGILNSGKGINSGNEFRKFSSRANLTYKLTDHLTIGTNTTWSGINRDLSPNPLLNAYNSPPLYNPINSDGTYGYAGLVSVSNPRAQLDLYRGKDDESRFVSNIWGEYSFWKDFSYKINYTLDNRYVNTFEYTPEMNYTGTTQLSKLTKTDYRVRNYVLDNTLSWKHNFGQHHVDALLGFSRQQVFFSKLVGTGNNVDYYGDSSLYFLGQATDVKINETAGKDRIESYFGRINYDYANKYMINASLRRDGATGFDSENRYHWFPAVSAGWVLSKEGFMENQNVFDLLKFRAGWGSLGNPDVPRSYNLNGKTGTAYFGSTLYTGVSTTDVIDSSIGWEVIEGLDYGVEMAFLNNKLKVEATYFDKDSKDVVYAIAQPTISGATNKLVTNAFSFNNRGFEFSANYGGNIGQDFKFNLYGNLTTLKNEITSVLGGSYNETGPYLFGETITRLEAGQPVGSYYGFNVIGVFQNQAQVNAAPAQNGKTIGGFIFQDVNGDGVIDNNDKTFLGSPIPDFSYGFGLNLSAYNFDFAIDFQGVQGNEIYNYNREQRYGNESWDLNYYNNRWHGEGTSNTNSMVTNNQAIIKPNSFYVEDGSFIRVRNIQLGYTVPSNVNEHLNIQKLRVYVGAQNPWTSFKYNGFSPEILSSDPVQRGVDNNIYPLSAIYTLGLNLTF